MSSVMYIYQTSYQHYTNLCLQVDYEENRERLPFFEKHKNRKQIKGAEQLADFKKCVNLYKKDWKNLSHINLKPFKK